MVPGDQGHGAIGMEVRGGECGGMDGHRIGAVCDWQDQLDGFYLILLNKQFWPYTK